MTRLARLTVMTLATLAAVAAAALSPTADAASDRPWVEVTSPHFVVVSDAGEGTARKVGWQFEQVRAVLQKLWPWAHVEFDRPVIVFAARNEQALKELVPAYWEKKGGTRPASVFVTGADRHWVALRADVPEPDSTQANPYFQTYWSYVYLVLNASFVKPLPLWVARGTSDFFANTIVRDKDIQVGRVPRWHLDTLGRTALLPLATVSAVDRQSPYMTREAEVEVFEASAWAYVHYLTFGEKGANRDRFNRFLLALETGKKPDEALRECYGDLAKVETAVRYYAGNSAFLYQQLDLDINVSSQGFRLRPLAAPEATAAKAALHAAMGRPVEARALAQEAIRANAALAAPYEVEGILCDRESKKDGARAAYAKAVDLESRNAYAYYRHAQLLWRADADPATLGRIEQALIKATTLNATYANGYSYLADVWVDLGRPAEALDAAKKAVGLEPGNSYHHFAMARALSRLSRSDEALREAERALALAGTDGDRQRAERFIAYLKSGTK